MRVCVCACVCVCMRVCVNAGEGSGDQAREGVGTIQRVHVASQGHFPGMQCAPGKGSPNGNVCCSTYLARGSSIGSLIYCRS